MIVLTGGAGFIGSAVLAHLNAAGVNDVIVVDNLGDSDKWRNLNGRTFDDYLHKDQFFKYVESGKFGIRPEVVIHLGACSSTFETNANYMLTNNYHYSRVIAEWCLSQKIRFLYASSAATYGAGEHGYLDDDGTVELLRPLNVYGYSKQLFDLWALRVGALKKITGIKFFNVFGPNEYHKGEMRSVVHKAFEQITAQGKVQLFKSHRNDVADGEQRRDFIYVKDCAEVIWWLLNNPTVSGLFNLGSGTARTWNDLARAVFAAMGKSVKIDYIDIPSAIRARYQYFTEANVTKLRSAGCHVPFTSLEDSVADYVKNHLAQPDPYL